MKWSQLWLNYKSDETLDGREYMDRICCAERSEVLDVTVAELQKFALETFGTVMKSQKHEMNEAGIVLKKVADESLGEEGFRISQSEKQIVIAGRSDKGLLYGSFHLIRHIRTGGTLSGYQTVQIPHCRYRMLNHWDNIDGSIERGYAGQSFFFRDEQVQTGARIEDYARLLASVGINQTAINNVNVRGKAVELITDEYLPQVKQIADIFGRYGIKLFLSIDFAAPMTLGELDTADPLQPEVQEWWQRSAAHIYEQIPAFGGFLVKADSEGRPGPFYYNRSHADGANMLGEALAPHGGRVIWRCFVYNCAQDWRDETVDRAKAAYECFMPVDGTFADNIILQIKNGPMDFQVREPVSPLFGGLKQTNQMLEFQIAQEYTGQQIDICYLVPMWQEVLSFRTYCQEEQDTVADIISGKTFGQTECGIAAVANTGDDENWTGHDLAGANLYGFGRIAWNPDIAAEDIAEEWIRITFGNKERVITGIKSILMGSWPAYEKYTTPYGLGWMITPHTHYGPSPEGYEYDMWGTYHKADCQAIGTERGSSGTNYAGQYHKPNAERFDTTASCPEELLLFFHRVAYDHRMKNGQTLLQNLYDQHFEGAEEVERFMDIWTSMKENIEEDVYERVTKRLERQYKNSKEWRDIMNTYFYRKTLTADRRNRKIFR